MDGDFFQLNIIDLISRRLFANSFLVMDMILKLQVLVKNMENFSRKFLENYQAKSDPELIHTKSISAGNNHKGLLEKMLQLVIKEVEKKLVP